MTDDLTSHEPLLRALAYRMLGTLQDAEDVVQEAFVRALASPPPDTARSWRPWLVRVTMNLARDRLRRRRHTDYPGTWLPEAVPLDAVGPDVLAARAHDVGYAWMVALESLTPEQRAVVVLREVLDVDTDEAASLLGGTPASVRALHTRARRALATQPVATAAVEAEAVARFLTALGAGDVEAMCAVLSDDVRLHADAAGRYAAAGVPVVGPARTASVLLALARRGAAGASASVVEVLGRAALLVVPEHPRPRWAPRSLTLFAVDPQGRIRAVYNVLADEKVARFA